MDINDSRGRARRALRVRLAGASGIAALTMVLAGCSSDTGGDTSGDTGHDTGTGAGTTTGTTAGGQADLPQGSEPVELDPADFTAEVTNELFPLEPGTRWVYQETGDQGEQLEVVVTATSQTRKIANGLTARVVRDTVTADGRIIEDTLDWYAQHRDGSVWYLGEDTAEFEDGRISTRGGSFEAGVDGAMAGVIMPADPQPGPTYRQEYYKGEAEDNGAVLSRSEMADVPAGHFEDLLLTKDTITIEPDVLEYKLYAPGVGMVLALGISGGGGREELVEQTTVPADVAAAAGTAPLGTPYG